MAKVPMGSFPYVYPIPTVILGADVDGKPNYSTIGNCCIVSVHPAAVCISSHRSHHTNKGINESKVFSLNFPSTVLAAKADFCGLVSGRDVDKSGVFTTFRGKEVAAPMAEECPVNLTCRVVHSFALHEMEVFIADVVESYIDDGCIRDGKPRIELVDPLLYSIRGDYWSIGAEVAKAFSTGRSLMGAPNRTE